MNYRFPFETALTSNEQAFRSYDHLTLQALTQRMQIVRNIVARNVKDARTNMEKVRYVGTKPHTFQEGERVFISSQLDQSRALNTKHARKFAGPYVILEMRNNLAKVAHMYTGRQLPSYINVDKLIHLRDIGRSSIY
jgi:cytochrome c-type biogenesis protein CcmE